MHNSRMNTFAVTSTLTFLFFSLASQATPPTAVAYEFYNTDLRHYFSAIDPEASMIDAGSAGQNWFRTGASFGVYRQASDSPSAVPVYRFYSRSKNSHFYTATNNEYQAVLNDPGWIPEGIAFYVEPVQANGTCVAGATAVHRSYNNRHAQNDPNHRFLIDYTVHAKMANQGSVLEGVAFCSPLSVAQVEADVVRFLEQASFGPTPSLIDYVKNIGIEAFIEEQFAAPKTQYPAYPYVTPNRPDSCVDDRTLPVTPTSYCARDNYTLFQLQLEFFRNALRNPDQLRQRVAFALSQILVTSGVDVNHVYGMSRYQQIFLDKAFDNYENILTAITLSPVMGEYLNMVNNDKPNATTGSTPNENYARELLQLFSIGVYDLRPDGSVLTDQNGMPIASYSQAEVEGFAHVFTGWTFPTLTGTPTNFSFQRNYLYDMVPISSRHDTGAKLLLDGAQAPAGLSIQQDLQNAIRNVFAHPNVGPFIGKQLIQKLVTGDPSPGYVSRITAVFDNNGQGVRGDMKAVIKAILLDPEARGDKKLDPAYGKLREPVLYITGMARALNTNSDGVFFRTQAGGLGQPVFYSPTVFNYYPPDYQVPGTTLLGPEFAILNSTTAINRINYANAFLFNTINPDSSVYGATGTQLDFASLQALASNPTTLVDELNRRFLHGRLSDAMKTAIVTAVNAVSSTDSLGRARTAAYLVVTSPHYQIQR